MTKQLVIDNTPACVPIAEAIEKLKALNFVIVEQKLSDYHFKELFFRLRGDLSLIKGLTFEGINRVDNKLLCNCHWSTIELVQAFPV